MVTVLTSLATGRLLRVMARIISLLSLVVFPLPLAAENGLVHHDPALVEIAFGAFCQMESVDSVAAPDTLAQRVDLLPETPHIRWPGPVIPALAGLSFGVRTETGGIRFDSVTIEVTHPPFPGSGMTHQSYVTALGGDEASINAYSFDLPEEQVTGTWTIRATFEDGILYEVRFRVVPPGEAPWIGRDCGKDFIS